MLIGIQDEILKINSLGILDLLLQDKTSGKRILWATDAYSSYGDMYNRDREITPNLITGVQYAVIKNRARKDIEEQSERTKQHAEVFTPFWICKKMNDYADEMWLKEHSPESLADGFTNIRDMIEEKDWQTYVYSRRMELTCGEGPFLVTAYDVSSGTVIALDDRAGILDRKLQVISRFVDDEDEWIKWAMRALQSTYGYEFQGDNLLIARVNVLMTFEEYLETKFHRAPTAEEYSEVAEIIDWNIWQMDGFTGCIPHSKETDCFSLFDVVDGHTCKDEVVNTECAIRDWFGNDNKSLVTYVKLKEREKKMFDFIIGNPPYDEEIENNGRKSPIYNYFMDESFKLADVVELITPGRFLFDAGFTPKEWNHKMLNDPHLKVLMYEVNGAKIFPNTDIKGGVAVTYRDATQKCGPIGTFTSCDELNRIFQQVQKHCSFKLNLSSIVSPRGNYRLTNVFFMDFPDAPARLGDGTGNMLVSNIIEQIPEAFSDSKPIDGESYIRILGRVKQKRVYKYFKSKYIINNKYLETYNVLVPESNGSGAIGEVLSTPLIGAPLIGAPLIGATDSFISIGQFSNADEANACFKYVKTKFARAMLGMLKVTQHNPRNTWRYVPLQDFTANSDIDWSKSVAEIDMQLYLKYGLSDEEIAFIETNVQEMK